MHRLQFLITAAVVLSISLTEVAESTEQTSGHESLPKICTLDCPVNTSTTKTGSSCEVSENQEIQGQCCVLKTKINVVFGIDLQSCNITEEEFSTGIENMTNLMYISLEGNQLKALTSEDLHRNTNIMYLSLPGNLSCPGGPEAWGFINKSADGDTNCWNQVDVCTIHNGTCPENSHCVLSGVDSVECLCNDGYHGYKCMNKGEFPTTAFVLGITIPTVVLSALLWVTQRRYVKATDKKK